jgi:predicted Ser/Thr protein kinase
MDRDRSDLVRAALQEAVDGRYDIVDLHGRGGMGMVYCAHERELARLVAIKVLTPEHALTPQARERFRREARLAASLSHPSIVTVFGFGESRDFAYIVMEFIRGESLGRRLRHEGRLAPNVARHILLDLAGALDHAHGKQIIHRDLKPENVLIAADSGRVLLTDFGIAKALTDGSQLTPSRSALGTPEYMSPEQAAGERSIDGRSDLYSLGALGYTMLAGRPPHQGDSVADLMARIVTEEPVPLRILAPDAPQDLASAIMRCLEKSPERRWPDAHALWRALSREADEDDPGGAELRGITGFGAFVLLVIVSALSFAVSGFMSRDPSGAWFAIGAGSIVSVGFVIYARGIASGGYSLGDVLRVSMWPPKWWGLWWPRSLRRSRDVWDTLPTSARLVRVLLSIMFALTLVWFVMGRKPLWMMPIIRGLWGAVLLMVVIAFARWRHFGFSAHHASHLLFGPTVAPTFWSLPQVTGVLVTPSSAGASRATPIPKTVRGILHEIEEAAGDLTGRARQHGSAAADAARALVDEIERLDGDIEKLAGSVDPDDLARAQQSIAKLDETQRKPRQALEEYIRLMQEQAELLEVKRLHREDANGTLRELWTLINQARAQSARGTPDPELLDRLHALVTAIRRQFGGSS